MIGVPQEELARRIREAERGWVKRTTEIQGM